jgi:hypothetical protein
MSRLWDSRQVRSLSLPCVKTAISLSRRQCSDVDPNVEITLLDVTVPSDQVYSELGAVDPYASVRRKGHRPACRVTSEPLLHFLFRGNNLRNIRRF